MIKHLVLQGLLCNVHKVKNFPEEKPEILSLRIPRLHMYVYIHIYI